jgi:TolB-like protein/DNA-binding winged helix-turn-helix (wHTH) protein
MKPQPTPDTGAAPTRFRIGDLEVDIGKAEVRRGEGTIALPKLSFDLLCALINAAPAIVTNDELLQQVWPGLLVSPESVSQRVKLLRSAIGDDSQQPRYILGVRARGYRLIPVVEWLDDSKLPNSDATNPAINPPSAEIPGSTTSPAPTLKGSKHRRALLIVGAAIATILVVTTLRFVVVRTRPVPPPAALQSATAAAPVPGDAATSVSNYSIAVLPFVDMSEKKDQEFFADGMAEEIIDLLVKIPGLKVIGRTSSFQFKGKTADLRTIGTQLGVSYVLEGSVRKSGDHLRVTAQLINCRDGMHFWSETYDRDLSDVLKMQDEIAAQVVHALQFEANVAEYIASRPALRNNEAYMLVRQGWKAFERFDRQGWEQALNDYQRALELDPKLAEAAGALSNVYRYGGTVGFMPPAVALEKARNAAELALKLDPTLVAMHTSLGNMDFTFEWDWAAADKELNLALAHAPNDSDALENAAVLALSMGRADDALKQMNAALALDPLEPNINFFLSIVQLRRGRLAEAEAAIRRAIEISPTSIFDHYILGQVLLARNQPEAALAEMLKEKSDMARLGGSAMVYFTLGRKSDSDAAFAQMLKSYASIPSGIAAVYAYRGESDEAFKWLDRAYAEKDSLLYRIKYSPDFDKLHDDPRYKAFLKKMNLPE